MSDSILYILITIFTLLSIGLAFNIWRLFSLLKYKKKQQEATAIAHAKAAQQQKDYLIDSIRIISRSIFDGQCPMTEGCIRLKVLIDNYSPQLHQHPELHIVELIYSKTSHIPTLDAWKRLSPKEKLPLQQEMKSLEQRYSDDILTAARYLKEYPFEQRAH